MRKITICLFLSLIITTQMLGIDDIKVAVIKFRTAGVSDEIGEEMSDSLTIALNQIGLFSVYERVLITEVAKEVETELGFNPANIDAQLKGATVDYVVSGRISSIGKRRLKVTARLIRKKDLLVITSAQADYYLTHEWKSEKIAKDIAWQLTISFLEKSVEYPSRKIEKEMRNIMDDKKEVDRDYQKAKDILIKADEYSYEVERLIEKAKRSMRKGEYSTARINYEQAAKILEDKAIPNYEEAVDAYEEPVEGYQEVAKEFSEIGEIDYNYYKSAAKYWENYCLYLKELSENERNLAERRILIEKKNIEEYKEKAKEAEEREESGGVSAGKKPAFNRWVEFRVGYLSYSLTARERPEDYFLVTLPASEDDLYTYQQSLEEIIPEDESFDGVNIELYIVPVKFLIFAPDIYLGFNYLDYTFEDEPYQYGEYFPGQPYLLDEISIMEFGVGVDLVARVIPFLQLHAGYHIKFGTIEFFTFRTSTIYEELSSKQKYTVGNGVFGVTGILPFSSCMGSPFHGALTLDFSIITQTKRKKEEEQNEYPFYKGLNLSVGWITYF